MITKEQKILLLKQEFNLVNLNSESILTYKELIQFLDKKLSNEFDRSVIQQLYDRMNKQQDDRVTLKEFTRVFLEAEQALKSKIESAKKFLEEYHISRIECVQKLQQMRQEETINSYGIMDGSVLQINFIESQINMQLNKPYIDVICGDTKEVINFVNRSNNIITWNEQLSLSIYRGDPTEDIKICLMDQIQNQKQLIGQIIIPLHTLSDQYKHEELLDLEIKKNQYSSKLYITIQWIHSKVKYLQDMINTWEEHIQLQQDDLMDYERDLGILYEPFQMFQNNLKIIQNNLTTNQFPKTFTKSQNLNINTNLINKQNYEYEYTALKATYVWIIILLLNSLYRPYFLDFIIGFYFIGIQSQNLLKENYLIYLISSLVISILLDIGWFVEYTKPWTSGIGVDNTDPEVEWFIKMYTVVMSFIIGVTKVIIIFVYSLLSQEIAKEKENKQANKKKNQEENTKTKNVQQSIQEMENIAMSPRGVIPSKKSQQNSIYYFTPVDK